MPSARESAPLTISETTLLAQLLAQNPVLLAKVVDRLLLLFVQPTSEGNSDEMQEDEEAIHGEGKPIAAICKSLRRRTFEFPDPTLFVNHSLVADVLGRMRCAVFIVTALGVALSSCQSPRLAWFGPDIPRSDPPTNDDLPFAPLPPGQFAFWVSGADGQDRRRALGEVVGIRERPPRVAWLADGRHFVVCQETRRTRYEPLRVFPDLWLVSGDGGTPKKLVTLGVTVGFAPSPDGKWVAYTRWDSGLWKVEVATGQRSLLAGGFFKSWEPVWSPDGSHILFRGFHDVYESGMWEVSADGTGLRRVSDSLSWPSYAPDGSAIVALEYTWPPGPKRVFQVDPNTFERRVIAEGAASEEPPVLSPDGSRVAFVRHDDGVLALVGVGSNQELVTLGKGSQPAWSPDGRRLAYVRDGHVVILQLETGAEVDLGLGENPTWAPR